MISRTVFALGSLLAAIPALASDAAPQASACYAISNPDARAACLAKAHGDPGRCYAVSAPDRRAQCLAEVRK